MEEKKEEILEGTTQEPVAQEATETIDNTEMPEAEAAATEAEVSEELDKLAEEAEKKLEEEQKEFSKKTSELYDKLAAVCDEGNPDPIIVLNAAIRLAHEAIEKQENPLVARDLRFQLAIGELFALKDFNALDIRRAYAKKAAAEAEAACACKDCSCKEHGEDGVPAEADGVKEADTEGEAPAEAE